MSQWLLNVKDFPRKNLFPFHVEQIFYCNNEMIPASCRKWECFEVCLRISSEADSTEDIVDGRLVKMPCPNVVWRLPGSVWTNSRSSVRDVISFGYSPEVLKTMELLGMTVEDLAWNFAMTAELERLIAKFHRTINHLYTPGSADELDWICFSLMMTLRLQKNMVSPVLNQENRIRNISIWFQTHYAEKINIDEIEAANGFSHDHFFKNWKKYFDLSPAQYINDLRLEAAAKRLKGTEIPISDIIQEVHFAGEYMFYQRFRQKFGMTPDQYRKQNKTDGLI